jgi:CBS domain-containing protein
LICRNNPDPAAGYPARNKLRRRSAMKAKDVMTTDVLTVNQDASVLEAARMMLQRRISGLPVVNASGALVGMVSEGDFLRRSELGTQPRHPRWIEFLMGAGRLADEYIQTSGRKVREVMTPAVYSVTEDVPLEEIVELMEHRRIKRVPVLSGNKITGIVTRSNLLRAFAGVVHEAPRASADDNAIRLKLIGEMKKQPWAPLAVTDIEVHSGVVKLSGVVLDDRQRAALRVAAENIPGVKKVEDNIVWIEPMSGTVLEARAEN